MAGDRKKLVTQEDYDIIIRDGFEPWYLNFMKRKTPRSAHPDETACGIRSYRQKRFEDAGYVVIKNSSLLTPL